MRVKAYKDRKSVRVTVPKQYYDEFAKISESLCGRKVPWLIKRTVLITRYSQDEYEPIFSNCDFGLALYIGPPSHEYMSSVRQYGKTSYGFNLSRIGSAYLDLLAGSTLECEILENTSPEPGFYENIIGYRKLASANKSQVDDESTTKRQDGQT